MAAHVRVVNKTRQTIILEHAAVADSFGARLKGLLGCKSLPGGTGVLIKPCRSVHTCGMKFSIDVGFVDARGRLCCLLHRMRPFRFSKNVRDAVYVIEAPAGTFEQTGTCEGDAVALEQLYG